jgi:hypothetical protein
MKLLIVQTPPITRYIITHTPISSTPSPEHPHSVSLRQRERRISINKKAMGKFILLPILNIKILKSKPGNKYSGTNISDIFETNIFLNP